MATLGLPPTTSHGGSDSNISTDGSSAAASGAASGAAGGAEGPSPGEPHRTRAALEHLQQKILKVTEQIRVEQEARDDNVAEYLKLAHNADKQQASRIKQVFEKKNQKSAQSIAHLHKKLEHYHKKLKEIEQVSVSGPTLEPFASHPEMHEFRTARTPYGSMCFIITSEQCLEIQVIIDRNQIKHALNLSVYCLN